MATEDTSATEQAVGHQEFQWRGRGGPFTIELRPGVFSPSSTSRVLADAMTINPGETVLDVGCGSGVLGFVAARLGATRVIGCDLSEDSVACATANAQRLGLADVTEFRTGSLFDPVPDVRADIIIADVSGVADAVAEATGWFPSGRGGGPTGAELPVAMLEQVGDHLTPGGRLYLPTGGVQDEGAVLKAARRIFGDNIQAVAQRDFPLPDVVTKAKQVAKLLSDGVIRLSQRGSRHVWQVTIWQCQLA
ncbi:MAG: methyltransferase domain-containing protein [Actinomycetes bacterium]